MFLESARNVSALDMDILTKLFVQTNVDGQNCFHGAFMRETTSILNTILDFIQDYPDIRKELLLQSDGHGEGPLCKLLTHKTALLTHS